MLKVNEYFEGKVKSIAFQTATLPATVGVMEVGEYQFDTSKKETVTIVSGSLTVKLPGSDQWQTFPSGKTFVVDAHKVFQLKVDEETAYLCTYE
jgi:purine/pyrimidine-nucleoside phosphorylase